MVTVLHVTETYATGVARALAAMVEEAGNEQHHLLYAGWESPNPGGFTSATRLPSGLVARTLAVRNRAKEVSADVVHLHSSWAGVYGRLGRVGARVAYQPHCFVFEDLSRPSWQRHLFRCAETVLGRRTDVFVGVSERELRLGAAVSPSARLVLAPNRSDLARLDVRPDPPDLPTVVMSGELRAQKDPDYFAEVARRVRIESPEVKFVWIGGGTDRRYRGVLADSGVRLTGWLDRAQLQAELDRASVYLHTASYEGFPLSILDAAARYLPVLVRRATAFEGLGLRLHDTPDAAASAILEHLSGASDVAVENTEQLRRRFDPQDLRSAVKDLYGRAER